MENPNITKYFLGANSRYGFYSLYDELSPPKSSNFLWVIKGGPGCGKSSFMKKIARACESAGLPVEYIYCSGDPNSLDAIILPTLSTAYVDGTAPHIVEAVYPGAASKYLDLGSCYDSEALKKELSSIIELNISYKELYKRAYAYLEAAADTCCACTSAVLRLCDTNKMDTKIEKFVSRELRASDAVPSVRKRFISALSCQGRVFMQDTIQSCCNKVYVLESRIGLENCYLDKLSHAAQAKKAAMVQCPSPLDPKLLEAVIFPEKRLAFVSSDYAANIDSKLCRRIHLDNFVKKELLAEMRSKMRKSKLLSEELLKNATAALHEAKLLHDKLEEIYNPHVDFDGVYSMAEEHISLLLEKH